MDVLSTSQAAVELGVTQRRVLALIAGGRLPAQRVGSYYAIKRADLARVKDRKPGRPSTRKATQRPKRD